ncbi:MAG: aromatic ring-hydroxylating dioxygenase subunit alpha, partial [Deltaproteobacteria bacterium]|nr:aromatic ring-hydroxylating dioxygenase subunit alpha [Deltaproteobacteria bacterium]
TPTSVFKLDRYWYVACSSSELKPGRVLARTVLGMPLALFRSAQGHVGALLDRCPHRNVPLSEGRVVERNLECPYHGWQFDTAGTCRKVPGLCAAQEHPSRNANHLAVREQDGLVWVWGRPDDEPTSEPFALRNLGPSYTTVRRSVMFPGSLHQSIENALDVPHTAFLHRGLFRGAGSTNRIQAVLTRTGTSVQAEYQGEPRPEGIAARILAPGGGIVEHWDRFHMPCVAEVEYKLGDDLHFLVTTFMTPEEDFLTRAHAVISFKLRLPGWLVAPILLPFALAVFKQDARVLGQQTDNIRRFGGERFISTEIDLLGGQIRRLMKRGEKGRADSSEPDEDYRAVVELDA